MSNTLQMLVSGLLGAMLVSGCATVVNGASQKIGVSSTPPGATVLIDNQQKIVTPGSLWLTRDQSHAFFFKKDGYQDDSFVITSSASSWLWGNMIAGGLIGGFVDLSTGAARKLSQDSVHVTLVPLPTVQIPPPAPMPTGGGK